MNEAKKIIIGLTGNIATGKSTVMGLAAARGAHIIDADKVSHQVMAHDVQAKVEIRAAFGDAIFDADGFVIRPKLGRIVFGDPAALKQLENIMHPAIRRTIVDEIKESNASVVMLEAIKLVEGPLQDEVVQVWVTVCSQYVQIERLMKYRNMSEEDARQRVMAQSPQELKIAKADVVIDTNGALSATEAQFEAAWAQLEF